MPSGLLDLSIVTNKLIELLVTACTNNPLLLNSLPPFDINVTGLSPDAIRDINDSKCQLSLYLFHVSPNQFQRNSPVTNPYTGQATRPPVSLSQPLSLDLYYLLTAYSKNNYIQEQQAMSIALKYLHQNPIIKIPIAGRMDEFCLTMEVESVDQTGQLWQGIDSSLRLSVIYKVSVVFIEPPTPQPIVKQVETFNLEVISASFPQVISTDIKVNYTGPKDLELNKRSYELSPAVVAPGQSFLLKGNFLNQSTSNHIYLLFPDGTEQDVTATWIADPTQQTESHFTLKIPPTLALTPGIYQLQVGDGGIIRSNSTPFSIASRVDNTGSPILNPVGGTYTLNGINFSSGNLEVFLDAIPLTKNVTLAPGKFTVNVTGTAISFQLPTDLPDGLYRVRVRVNQVESHPAKWVEKTL
jgi:Pvc16 N-terminal domain